MREAGAGLLSSEGLVLACAAGLGVGLLAMGRVTERGEAGAEGRRELLWEETWRYLAARCGSRLGTRTRQGCCAEDGVAVGGGEEAGASVVPGFDALGWSGGTRRAGHWVRVGHRTGAAGPGGQMSIDARACTRRRFGALSGEKPPRWPAPAHPMIDEPIAPPQLARVFALQVSGEGVFLPGLADLSPAPPLGGCSHPCCSPPTCTEANARSRVRARTTRQKNTRARTAGQHPRAYKLDKAKE